jgi:membrane protease YdiL (CAAX protease family)
VDQLLFLLLLLGGSGILLWTYERRWFSGLGISPTSRRMRDLAFGLVASSIVAAIGYGIVTLVSGAALKRNPDFTTSQFLSGSFWMLKSVLIEELLFRGALLYIGIRLLGVHKGCFLSSLAFGVYHWFSYSVWGDAIQMLYIFLLTGAGGLLFAYAFAYTGSIYLPIGLHLGWNVISMVVFSQGSLGNQLLIATGGSPLGLWSIAIFIYQVLVLPLLTFFYLKQPSPHLGSVKGN